MADPDFEGSGKQQAQPPDSDAMWTPTPAGRSHRHRAATREIVPVGNATPTSTFNFILHSRQRNDELREGRGNTPSNLDATLGSQSQFGGENMESSTRHRDQSSLNHTLRSHASTTGGPLSRAGSVRSATRPVSGSSLVSPNPNMPAAQRQKISFVPKGYCTVLSADDQETRLLKLRKVVRKRCAITIAEWWLAVQGKQKRKAHAARLRTLILLNARATLIQQWWRALQSKDNTGLVFSPTPSPSQSMNLVQGGGPSVVASPLDATASSGVVQALNRDKQIDEQIAQLGKADHLEKILEIAKGDVIRAERAAVSHVRHAGIKKIWEGVTDKEPTYKRLRDKANEQLTPARSRQREWASASNDGSRTPSEDDGTRYQKESLSWQPQKGVRRSRKQHGQSSGATGANASLGGWMPPLLSKQARTYMSRQNPERGQQGRYLRDEDVAVQLAKKKRDARAVRGPHSKKEERRSSSAMGFELVPLDRNQVASRGGQHSLDGTMNTTMTSGVGQRGVDCSGFDNTIALRVTRPLATPAFWNGSTQTVVPSWYAKPMEAQKFKKVPDLVKYL